ncbi:MAG TPA: alpha/beta fold hydrolase [Bacteroidota bacterium]|nr:alpha/beta fold hydrolase [Bacteroidota bacterium]
MKAVINNSLTHYIDIGISTAQPVIFLHAFPFTHRMWMLPGGQTESLSGSNRLVAYDVRGHGESEIGQGIFTVEFLVDDLIAMMDHLKIRQAIIVGLSMGGYIALRAAERHPARIKALVLCDTKSAADSNEAKIKRSGQIKTIRTDGTRVFAEEFMKGAVSAETIESKPDVVRTLQGMIERTSPVTLCGTLVALAARTDTTPALASIQCPVLILHGEKDALISPAEAKAMKEKIPNAELQLISKAGHLSNAENAEEFNKHLIDFVRRNS